MKHLLVTLLAFPATASGLVAAPLNVLLFTADDLGHEQLDFHGGGVPDVTPNLSKFSADNHTFLRGHVNIAICAPSRSIIATGRYGFNPLPKKNPHRFFPF